jgi:sec-independent protein translocase protein TatA
MFGLGSQELFLILIIAVVMFGANKVPELARALGRSMSEFKKGMHDLEEREKPAAEGKTEPRA